mmetsp:Transcript_47098/g.110931  ORF Transcript_47098/g.110931 Transcript_47098/m.110931 type:complete len:80 (+) Transcript_47098:253-492(+)
MVMTSTCVPVVTTTQRIDAHHLQLTSMSRSCADYSCSSWFSLIPGLEQMQSEAHDLLLAGCEAALGLSRRRYFRVETLR